MFSARFAPAAPLLCSLLGTFELSCQSKSSARPPEVRELSGPSAVSAPTPSPCKDGAQSECVTRCDQGSLESCVTLGLMLARGDGGTKDATRAAALFQRACDGKVPVGCGSLGEMYVAGAGVDRNVQRGLLLLQGACEQADALACDSLGGLYLGIEPDTRALVPQDYQAASKWYEKGCALDDVAACVNLGAILGDGAAGTKDQGRANQLFLKGCDANDALGCKLLADAYAQGDGVAKDTKRAGVLYEKACRGGNAQACRDVQSRTGTQ